MAINDKKKQELANAVRAKAMVENWEAKVDIKVIPHWRIKQDLSDADLLLWLRDLVKHILLKDTLLEWKTLNPDIREDVAQFVKKEEE